MNDGFKQRLVGALVLICLALILWPILFTDVHGPIVSRESQIPTVPSFEKYQIAEPVRSAAVPPVPETTGQSWQEPSKITSTVEAAEKDSKASSPAQKNAKAASPPKQATLDKQGLPISWVLQVASFSNAENARELKRALQDKGYKAYTREVSASKAKATRVYVGPKINRDAILKDKQAIDKAFSLNTLIVRFER